jgi:response regulator RpfG family c-di-GMP phosphodiesterase
METKKYSVLYVDDEDVNLRVFTSTFRRDFIIFTANSAKQGLQLLEEHQIDVVITDQRMPEITGVEFLKMVHEKFHRIPPNRLMISGFSKPEDIDKAFKEYKLFKFVSKPWNSSELKEIIFKAIEHGK